MVENGINFDKNRAAQVAAGTAITAGVIALAASEASAWDEEVFTHEKCIPNSATGTAEREFGFTNFDDEAMNVRVILGGEKQGNKIVGGQVVFAENDVRPGETVGDVLESPAPADEIAVWFEETWTSGKPGKDFVGDHFKKVDVCPAPTTTTTVKPTTTTTAPKPTATTAAPVTTTTKPVEQTTTTTKPAESTTTTSKPVESTTTTTVGFPQELPRTGETNAPLAGGAVLAAAIGAALVRRFGFKRKAV